MMRILHISDPHAEPETMLRLHSLAVSRADCEVVALTGDCLSKERPGKGDPLPEAWDRWPQRLKLSVPGNHDDPSRTYVHLRSWLHQAPWVHRLDDLVFVGLDLFSRGVAEQLAVVERCADHSDAVGVVLLSHEPLPRRPASPFVSALKEFIGERLLLVLHGHAHGDRFPGSDWDDHAMLAGKRYWRSNVRSSQPSREGLAHLIEWRGRGFSCSLVRGELELAANALPGLRTGQDVLD